MSDINLLKTPPPSHCRKGFLLRGTQKIDLLSPEVEALRYLILSSQFPKDSILTKIKQIRKLLSEVESSVQSSQTRMEGKKKELKSGRVAGIANASYGYRER